MRISNLNLVALGHGADELANWDRTACGHRQTRVGNWNCAPGLKSSSY